ncbi:hypothetical protein CEXT_100381 [Caerostris extrusa]|uniref:Uncharacterized protein n=1 Tax=Caerostris extrusa TaxID=172846 RepID=A0AAV4NB48_CAEEX|nr:hypothetical protein CEXT_100381 [Caerostris extrusa]
MVLTAYGILKDCIKINHLPDCLGRLPETSVEVVLNFKTFIEVCDEDKVFELQNITKHLLVSMNQEKCQVVDCDSFNVSCYFDFLSNKNILNNTWILKAAYNPSDYGENDIPDAEINIDSILSRTKKEINSPNGNLSLTEVEFDKNSFFQSHFSLICEKGDMLLMKIITNVLNVHLGQWKRMVNVLIVHLVIFNSHLVKCFVKFVQILQFHQKAYQKCVQVDYIIAVPKEIFSSLIQVPKMATDILFSDWKRIYSKSSEIKNYLI